MKRKVAIYARVSTEHEDAPNRFPLVYGSQAAIKAGSNK